jgi:hypothetical protein
MVLWFGFGLTLQFPVPFGIDNFLFFQIFYLFTTEMNQATDRARKVHVVVRSPLFELIGGHVADKAAGTVGRFDSNQMSLFTFLPFTHRSSLEWSVAGGQRRRVRSA